MGGAQRSRVRWERVSCVPGTNEIRLKADVVVILVVDKGPLEGSATNSQTLPRQSQALADASGLDRNQPCH
jgi:hypothetical protein